MIQASSACISARATSTVWSAQEALIKTKVIKNNLFANVNRIDYGVNTVINALVGVFLRIELYNVVLQNKSLLAARKVGYFLYKLGTLFLGDERCRLHRVHQNM